MSGTRSASTTRHPPRGKSTLPEARATSRYRIYDEPHPQITVDQPEPPPPRVVNRAGKDFSLGRPTAGPAGGSMPEDARKTRYTAQIKSGKLSAKPARSRSGVKPARTPCSKTSSKLSRDRVRSVRSVFPLSVFSARKPSVWLPVQASTVKVMSAETSRPAPDSAGGLAHQSGVPRNVAKLLQRQQRTLEHHRHRKEHGKTGQKSPETIHAGYNLGRGERQSRTPATKRQGRHGGGIPDPGTRCRCR